MRVPLRMLRWFQRAPTLFPSLPLGSLAPPHTRASLLLLPRPFSGGTFARVPLNAAAATSSSTGTAAAASATIAASSSLRAFTSRQYWSMPRLRSRSTPRATLKASQNAQSLSSAVPRRLVSSGIKPPASTQPPVQSPPETPVSPKSGGSLLFAPWRWLMANKAALSQLARESGWLAAATYLSVYVLTLSALFAAVHSGALAALGMAPLDVAGAIHARLPEWLWKPLLGESGKLSPLFVEFGAAWLLTKTTEPLRLVATIALVPLLRRYAPLMLLRFFGAVPVARSNARK